MIAIPSLFAVGSLALTIGVAALIAVTAAFTPLRWGWKAFPLAVVASVLTAAFFILAAAESLYREGGGFVVHFNVLHLAAASALGAVAFGFIRKARLARRDG